MHPAPRSSDHERWQTEYLTTALESVHKDDLESALATLTSAASVFPDSLEISMHLGFVYCALHKEEQARAHLQRALPPSPSSSSWSAVATTEGAYDSGDTVLEAAVREQLAAAAPCAPLPLLYPSALVVDESAEIIREVGEGGRVGEGEGEMEYKRVYYLDRMDGEGSMVVKQTSTLGAAREAYVLHELRYSAGMRDDGNLPGFPHVFGSLVSRRWTACAVSNFDSAMTLAERVAEEPLLFNETGPVFDIIDRLLQIVQQMQGAGVVHRALTARSIMMLAGDVPAIVAFDYAVAQGMPFAVPALPPHLDDIYLPANSWGARGLKSALERVEPPAEAGGQAAAVSMLAAVAEQTMQGEVLQNESDVYALGLLLIETLPVAATAFAKLLEVMSERQRHERITHVMSLRLLLGSLIESRADLQEFHHKIFTNRANYFDQTVAFPDNGVPHNNLGSVYFDNQLLNDALSLFQVALPQALPFKSGVRSNIAAVRKMMCHWGHYWDDARAIVEIIDAGGVEVRSIRNLYALALNLTMAQVCACLRGVVSSGLEREGVSQWAFKCT